MPTAQELANTAAEMKRLRAGTKCAEAVGISGYAFPPDEETRNLTATRYLSHTKEIMATGFDDTVNEATAKKQRAMKAGNAAANAAAKQRAAELAQEIANSKAEMQRLRAGLKCAAAVAVNGHAFPPDKETRALNATRYLSHAKEVQNGFDATVRSPTAMNRKVPLPIPGCKAKINASYCRYGSGCDGPRRAVERAAENAAIKAELKRLRGGLSCAAAVGVNGYSCPATLESTALYKARCISKAKEDQQGYKYSLPRRAASALPQITKPRHLAQPRAPPGFDIYTSTAKSAHDYHRDPYMSTIMYN